MIVSNPDHVYLPTEFLKFWPALNRELAARGRSEAMNGPAHHAFDWVQSPRAAADLIVTWREEREAVLGDIKL